MKTTSLRHRLAATAIKVHHSGRLFYLPVLLFVCTLFYYFGELVDWAAWAAARHEFFYGVHDIHRLVFLVPIIYAGYTARVKGAIIVTLVTFVFMLPRAFFISPFPDPLLRMVLFIIVAGAIGMLTGKIRNESERRCLLETRIKRERDKVVSILENMGDGVLITGPDYTVRFTNPSMVKDFGEGTGATCYSYLYHRNSPCHQICKLHAVIAGNVERWNYHFPDGRSYEILASPYIDSDGKACQLAIFRNISSGTKAMSQSERLATELQS